MNYYSTARHVPPNIETTLVEGVENPYCLGCLCSSKESRIQDYKIQYAHFLAMFEVTSIKLCYLCKRMAHHAEVFIQNVQSNQLLLENCLGDVSTTIKAAHSQLEPLKCLSHTTLVNISLTGTGTTDSIICSSSETNSKTHLKDGDIKQCNSVDQLSVNRNDTKLNGGIEEFCGREQDKDIIKTELKEEETLDHLEGEIVDDDELSTDSTNLLKAHRTPEDFQKLPVPEFQDFKDEDDFPLKAFLKKELQIETIERRLKRSLRKKKVKSKRSFEIKAEIQEPEVLDNNGVTGITEIETFHITEEQCMQERKQLASEEKYLNRTYKCADCIKGFNFKASYVVHMEKHSEAMGQFECDICKLRMDTEEKLACHKRYHTIRYKCNECGLVRISRLTIKDHYDAYHRQGERQYACPYCDKSFKRQVSQRKHVRYTHLKKERVICGYCHKSYANKDVLKSHMMSSHPKEVSANEAARPFACEQCGMTFKARSHLKNHSTKHSATRDYYCVECDKAFKTETVLKHHLKTAQPHVNYLELPLACQHCDRKFAIRRDLERHTNRVHLDVRPYTCDKCDKAYVTNWSLIDHRRHVHDGYKRPLRYPCKMCDKVFDRSSILKAHIRTHTGERPYQCSKCPAQFTQSGVLATHDKLIHLRLTRDGRPKPAGK